MDEKRKLEVRLNKAQVERAEEVLGLLGVSLSEAVSMFLAQILLRNGLPFKVAVSNQDDQEIPDRVMNSDLNDDEPDEGQLSLDDVQNDKLEVDEDDSD